jgi:uncharacterized protein with GYD domain
MIFITLIKFRKKAKDVVETGKRMMQNLPPDVKVLNTYWSLGRYDAVWIYEAKNEKDAVKIFVDAGDAMSTETLVAIPRDEAMKLL